MDAERAGVIAALGVAAALAIVALIDNTWAAGGSDSSCYALMADAFADGRLQPTSTLAVDAPWPNAQLTLAPAGFIPSPLRADAASPICTPGFSLLLTPLVVAGGANAFFLGTPIASAILIWLTFVVARAMSGTVAGVAAAIIVSTMPIVLFQVVQPMNDITTAMLWMAVLAAATTPSPLRPWLMGVGTGAALLVRPNLAPAAVVVGLWLLMQPGAARDRVLNAARMTAAALPGIAIVLLLNAWLYGHPLRFGYGSTDVLFNTSHVVVNVRHYGLAMLQTTFAIPLVGLAAPLYFRAEQRRLAWLAVGIAAATIGVYLLYQPFDEWWYLRFLLPALIALTSVAVPLIVDIVRKVRARRWVANAIVIAGVIIVAIVSVQIARQRQAFDLQRLEGRFWRTADVVADRLPANAVAIAVWQSGTIRFHANREAVLWDSLDPAWLDRAVEWLASRGHDPYLVLERWEEPLFRARFAAASAIGGLDWPPRFEIDRQVRIYHPSDRARYLQGESIATEHIIPRR